MQRKIVDFYQDDRGDWVALLDCAHGQHVRHNPPFTNRPWTQSEAGRQAKLGEVLECLKCDRFEMPEGLSRYKSTPEFNALSIPAGLTRVHTTKDGVWARIIVLEGALAYYAPIGEQIEHRGEKRADAPPTVLTPQTPGIVVPRMPHRIEPLQAVRFLVEFYRR